MTDQVSGIETDEEDAKNEHRAELEVAANLSPDKIEARIQVFEMVKWGFRSAKVNIILIYDLRDAY